MGSREEKKVKRKKRKLTGRERGRGGKGRGTRERLFSLGSVFQAEELPASVANLHACLADVDAKSLTHDC